DPRVTADGNLGLADATPSGLALKTQHSALKCRSSDGPSSGTDPFETGPAPWQLVRCCHWIASARPESSGAPAPPPLPTASSRSMTQPVSLSFEPGSASCRSHRPLEQSLPTVRPG